MHRALYSIIPLLYKLKLLLLFGLYTWLLRSSPIESLYRVMLNCVLMLGAVTHVMLIGWSRG